MTSNQALSIPKRVSSDGKRHYNRTNGIALRARQWGVWHAWHRSVNALYRVHVISTTQSRQTISFMSCVNALYRAHVISTTDMHYTLTQEWRGVNALYRAHVISTKVFTVDLDTQTVCQCPVSGTRHFYLHESLQSDRISHCVSMPCIGHTSFLRICGSTYC